MTEPRTHYQISLTSRQAVFLFAGLLVALGGAYFLGLMTGLPSREPAATPSDEARNARPAAAASDSLPPVETAVPTALASVASNALRAAPTPPAAEPTVPPTLQPFDDGASEEAASPLAEASPGKSPPRAPADGHPPAGRYWVQVASLTSKQEAGALAGKLSKRGWKSQILPADGPKGRGRVYRVRVGPYPSEDEAGRAAGRLSKQEKVGSPWVVPDGK